MCENPRNWGENSKHRENLKVNKKNKRVLDALNAEHQEGATQYQSINTMVSKLKFKSKKSQTRDAVGKIRKPGPRKPNPPATIKDTTDIKSSQNATDHSDEDALIIKEIVESSWHSASSANEIKGTLFLSMCDLGDFDDDEEEEEEKVDEEARQRVLQFYKKTKPKAISYNPKNGKVAISDENLDVLSEQAFSALWQTLRKATSQLEKNIKYFPVNNTIPNAKNQLFTVIPMDSLLSGNQTFLESQKQRELDKESTKVALKTIDGGRYLSMDRSNNELTLSSTMTSANEVFQIKRCKSPLSGEVAPWFNISINDHKLVLAKQGNEHVIKLIKDDENLLNNMNKFVIRLQMKNSRIGNSIIRSVES